MPTLNEDKEREDEMQDYLSYLPYSPMVRRSSDLENLIQWILNPTEIIELLEHNLRGEIPGEKKGEWIDKGEKMMNDLGVRKVISMAGARVNKVVTMSNLEEKDIKMMMFFFAMDLEDDFHDNFEKYDILFENLTTVAQMIEDFIYCALRQALNAGARNAWSKIQRVQTNIIEERGKKRNWLPGQFTQEPGGG